MISCASSLTKCWSGNTAEGAATVSLYNRETITGVCYSESALELKAVEALTNRGGNVKGALRI